MSVQQPPDSPGSRRFLQLDEVADELATSRAQVYALVRSKALPAIKIGGRGQWRIERSKLEEFIARAYKDTSNFVDENPFGASGPDAEGESDEPASGETP